MLTRIGYSYQELFTSIKKHAARCISWKAKGIKSVFVCLWFLEKPTYNLTLHDIK